MSNNDRLWIASVFYAILFLLLLLGYLSTDVFVTDFFGSKYRLGYFNGIIGTVIFFYLFDQYEPAFRELITGLRAIGRQETPNQIITPEPEPESDQMSAVTQNGISQLSPEEVNRLEMEAHKAITRPRDGFSEPMIFYRYVGSEREKIFHTIDCDAKNYLSKSEEIIFKSKEEAESEGFRPHSCVEDEYRVPKYS